MDRPANCIKPDGNCISGGCDTPESGHAAGATPSEIRPSLIGGFQSLSGITPSYWNPFVVANGDIASVDMVRLALTLTPSDYEWLSAHVETFQCDTLQEWTAKIRPGGWHRLDTFDLGNSSLTLGLGLFEPNNRLNTGKAFIEFNPNKVAGDKRFWSIAEKVSAHAAHVDLKRFDLAYDMVVDRRDCRLTKDRRMYQSVISNVITEYLGVKNSPGYVKVYDKASEMGLSGELTRIELTCSGEWTPQQLVTHWPQVHAWRCAEGTQDWVRVVGIMLAEKAERGEDIETLVNMLGKRSRPKVREYLRTPCIPLSESAAEAIIGEARSWRRAFGDRRVEGGVTHGKQDEQGEEPEATQRDLEQARLDL